MLYRHNAIYPGLAASFLLASSWACAAEPAPVPRPGRLVYQCSDPAGDLMRNATIRVKPGRAGDARPAYVLRIAATNVLPVDWPLPRGSRAEDMVKLADHFCASGEVIGGGSTSTPTHNRVRDHVAYDLTQRIFSTETTVYKCSASAESAYRRSSLTMIIHDTIDAVPIYTLRTEATGENERQWPATGMLDMAELKGMAHEFCRTGLHPVIPAPPPVLRR